MLCCMAFWQAPPNSPPIHTPCVHVLIVAGLPTKTKIWWSTKIKALQSCTVWGGRWMWALSLLNSWMLLVTYFAVFLTQDCPVFYEYPLPSAILLCWSFLFLRRVGFYFYATTWKIILHSVLGGGRKTAFLPVLLFQYQIVACRIKYAWNNICTSNSKEYS